MAADASPNRSDPSPAELRVPIRGVDLAVSERGEGPALIWGHGLLLSMAADNATGLFNWEGLSGVRLIRYDARGHGESGMSEDPDAFRWENLAADMLELAEAVDAKGPILAGASMGCATALHAASLAPGRVRGLVLVIPPTAWATRSRQQRFYRLGARMISTIGARAFGSVMTFLSRVAPRPEVLKGETARIQDALVGAISRVDRLRAPLIMQGAGRSDFPSEDEVARIDVPALILSWEGDPSHPRSTAKRLSELMRNAQWEHARTSADVLAWPQRIAKFVAGLDT